MRIFAKTVTIEVPLPFTDDEAQAFVDHLDYMDLLDQAITDAVYGVFKGAKDEGVPLADVASVRISE